MKIRSLLRLTSTALVAITLGACAPVGGATNNAGDVQRLSFGQSVDIASAGARISGLRAQNGITRPLGHNAALQAAAQAHADDMAQSGNFGHSGSGGSTLSSRLRAAGYSACFAAENLAWGQPTIGAALQEWMASADHRSNMLNPRAVAYGFAQAGTYQVLVLARPC